MKKLFKGYITRFLKWVAFSSEKQNLIRGPEETVHELNKEDPLFRSYLKEYRENFER